MIPKLANFTRLKLIGLKSLLILIDFFYLNLNGMNLVEIIKK